MRALGGLILFSFVFLFDQAKACKDLYHNCQGYAQYCYLPGAWENYMKQYCKGTCTKHCSTGGSSKCGISNVPQGRIIAGVDAKPGAWPWMASLNMRGRPSHFCGGSLITPTWVLTASHCTEGQRASGMQVILGEHNRYTQENTEQHINVKRIIMHRGYNRQNLQNDIALLELEKPAQLNERVQLVCLPPKGYRPSLGKKCYLAGWGTMTHPGQAARILQQAMLPVVDKKNCFNADAFVCTGYGRSSLINACRGDSGGPLVCQESDGRWVQQGVASFVVTYCKYYTAFTRVGDHMDWIRQFVSI